MKYKVRDVIRVFVLFEALLVQFGMKISSIFQIVKIHLFLNLVRTLLCSN